MTGSIFINYRRADSLSTAGRLHDRLAQAFGQSRLFMDVDHIPAGVDFVDHLNTQVAACQVFLAIIGPNWLNAKDSGGHRRLDNPDDFVTIEIAAALARGIDVIPVLIDDTSMPTAKVLPNSLRALAGRDAVEIRNDQFGRDADALIENLRHRLRGKPTKPDPRILAAASMVALLLAGWIGLHQMGLPAWAPWARTVMVRAGGGPDRTTADAPAKANGTEEEAELQRLAASETKEPDSKSEADTQPDPALAVKPGSGQSFRDPLANGLPCPMCPEMVVVPKGSFTMGGGVEGANNEGPQHDVTFARPFAVAKFHVTVDQFAAFVTETAYDAGAMCSTVEGGKREERSGRSWRNPGFPQEGSHPVVCLNWNGAQAYVEWVSRKTGASYRLLTEAEWEYAARARTDTGTYPRYSFGNDEKDQCRYGNGVDETTKNSNAAGITNWVAASCKDGYAYTSPVGRFAANNFGLYDMQGNAFQWTQDCYHDNYNGAPRDGSAWISGDCSRRVIRGGAWNSDPYQLRAAFRGRQPYNFRGHAIGFRVARSLNP